MTNIPEQTIHQYFSYFFFFGKPETQGIYNWSNCNIKQAVRFFRNIYGFFQYIGKVIINDNGRIISIYPGNDRSRDISGEG